MPAATTRGYAPLWVKTNYSFLEGASHPDELVERAHELGLPALALTDRDGVYGIVRAHVRAKELGVPLVIGAPRSPSVTSGGVALAPVVLLAKSRAGYGALCRCSRAGALRCARASRSCSSTRSRARRAKARRALRRRRRSLSGLRASYGDRLYALVARHRSRRGRRSEQRAARRGGCGSSVPVVAGVEVLYHTAARRPLQDVLACIRARRHARARPARVIRRNAEHALASAARDRASSSRDDPAALARTLEIADRAARSRSSQIRYRYPGERLPDGISETDWLRAAHLRGRARALRRGVPDDVRAQLERELALIHELDYGGYFLTMHEIVAVLPRGGDPVPGPRQRREQRRLLLPRHHRDRSGAHGSALRALPEPRARRAARHRPRHRARAPRGGDPVRLRDATAGATPRWSRT